MKEMIYTKRQQRAEVLTHSTYKNYEYVVLSLGSHPCGYVIIEKDNILFGKNYDDIHDEYDIWVHGGLTYSKDYLNFLEFSNKYKSLVKSSIQDKWVLGWDYAHYNDYFGVDDFAENKKWTTSEIVEECKNFITQIIEINKEA